ncbi:glycosyl hydrolase family 61-domain-containing protein [Plectosphaerella plurivora]|uniref:lytic cellulose monooxygenase (C4-dehydrogenating) n=1 Tax=Plectosphaerella plurivora TaxID=936078 RepID=A0A9P8V3Z0_9PEZI|nr:glycosyl hydrolase family 61-domain-containing protein [Plectosphaerella plurivora]
MPSIKTSGVLSALASAALVSAHGHVDWINIDGVRYRGYDSPAFPYQPNHAPVIGWKVNVPDNGFVEPSKFNHPDIICHTDGTPAPVHAEVKPGSKMLFQWDTWPESHQGPVIDYIARCNGPCETVDKTTLEWVRISESGLIDKRTFSGYWGADVLMDNNFSWVVQIPQDIAPGNYVIRHEILALHGGANPNGAQAYPQCFNVKVSASSGTWVPTGGVKGTDLYRATDAGVLFNIFTPFTSYPIPGPAIRPGLPATSASQVSTTHTATGTPTPPGTGPEPTFVPPSSTAGAVTTRATTLVTSSRTSSAAPATTSATGPTAAKWAQCGGQGWTGPTVCVAGSTCTALNPFYSQCT